MIAAFLACPFTMAAITSAQISTARNECSVLKKPGFPEADPQLTRRESEVLELIGRGFSNKEIGSELGLSMPTAKRHVHHVLEKLSVFSRANAMRRVRDAFWLGRSIAAGR